MDKPQNHAAEDVRDVLARVAGASEASVALAALQSGQLGIGAPFSQPIKIVTRARLAGTTNRRNIDDICDVLQPGDCLRFRRDADNRDDRWSVHVLAPDGQLMGYVPADINEIVAQLMDAGKKLYGVFIEVERVNSWNKIYFEVNLED